MTRWSRRNPGAGGRLECFRAVCNDLRAAGPVELCWRAWAGTTNRFGLRRRRFAPPTAEAFRAALPAEARKPEALQDWLRRRPSHFLFDPGARELYRPYLGRFPSPCTRADRLVEDAILLFGRPVAVPDPWDWHADPVSGARWPATGHWSVLSVSGTPGSDVRRMWERNRHRDQYVLGRAYWATGDERYARAAAERLDHWRAGNPVEQGINWWSNLEVAVRAIAWVWALHFFRDAAAFTAPRLWELVRFCWMAGQHLERDLQHSVRTMPGNHVIGDAAGLAVLALALPELADAPRWLRRALAVLEREADAQVAPDGAHGEESPTYHAFVWELLCLAALLARRQNVTLPNVWRALARMPDPLVLTARPDGSLPATGDCDGSVAFDLSEESSRAAVVGATSAVLFGRADLKAAVREPVEAVLWLLGPDALDAWSALPAVEPPAPRVTGFGLAVRSSGDRRADWWFMRGGTQSRHTHADALHLEIVVGGEALLEDSGTGPYNASAGWRRHARSTRAHNTIVVDGLDQATMHRTFRWLTPLRVTWKYAGSEDGSWYADATHNGYRRRGLSHRRRVWWRPDWGWLVLDDLEGRGAHDVELRWHTTGAADRVGDGVRITGRGGAVLQMTTAPTLAFEVETTRQGDHDGWMASGYTRLEPGTIVSVRTRLSCPAVVATFLCPRPGSGRVGVSLDVTSHSLQVQLHASDRVLDLEIPNEGVPRERTPCGS